MFHLSDDNFNKWPSPYFWVADTSGLSDFEFWPLFVYLKGFFFPKLKSFCGYLKVGFPTLSDLLVTAWAKHGGTSCFFLVFLIVGGGLISWAFNFSKGTCFNEPRFSVNLLPLQRSFHWVSIEATFFFLLKIVVAYCLCSNLEWTFLEACRSSLF